MATICSCATAWARERPLSSWLSTGGGDGVGSDSPMRALPREGEEQVDSGNGHDALDSVRSWLASGAQMVDRRRRFGDHGRTRKLLLVDPSARPNASERWHSTTSALQRHTVGGALSELEPEHRRVITLAYLEGQTNRQIAATLGVSVTPRDAGCGRRSSGSSCTSAPRGRGWLGCSSASASTCFQGSPS